MRMANLTETSHLGTGAVSGPHSNGDWLGPVYIEGPGIYRQIGGARRGKRKAIETGLESEGAAAAEITKPKRLRDRY